MSKLHAAAPGRAALASLATLAAALLLPLADAAAQTAPPTVASQLCNYATNKPPLLQAQLQAIFVADGFIGLPADQCPKFVKELVKSCVELVKVVTKCSTDINAMVGKIETPVCDGQPDKDAIKSCKQNVKKELQDSQATASQTVKLVGERICNTTYAAHFEAVCLAGVVP